jgi:hypothetical protein
MGAGPGAADRGEKARRFFELPLSMRSRVLALIAALALMPVYFFPLWHMTLYSNQFPDGLNVYIYSHKLEGGRPAGRDDLREINTLNRYIGMRPLLESDFSEFLWLPLATGLFVILTLRTVVIGKMVGLVDNAVLFSYFGLFSLWSFYNRLHQYGHNLDPAAAVKVPPFMPPLAGWKQIANFTVYSYPGAASALLVLFFVLLAAAIWTSRKQLKPS